MVEPSELGILLADSRAAPGELSTRRCASRRGPMTAFPQQLWRTTLSDTAPGGRTGMLGPCTVCFPHP